MVEVGYHRLECGIGWIMVFAWSSSASGLPADRGTRELSELAVHCSSAGFCEVVGGIFTL